ncbi:hypothetical protein J31TS4_11200 [Paenibacillus sp. J31TS4]|uniref:hypothetical protein n=1 Tax=Paenibacillus sp. J31TS4 TaxID=2807195 RepID=UPI001B139B79|nr:hypothetical protein [Paenibacillus sp. J31TS4]GIP37840.1 hypothetical protein J31TS4_11200 [Paenibacillus sp. J31TS4]
MSKLLKKGSTGKTVVKPKPPMKKAAPKRKGRTKQTLTGTWKGDDNALYYIRQVGNIVWWAGLSDNGSGTQFTNVFRGPIDEDEIIRGRWADVPRGVNRGRGGLTLEVVSDTQINKIAQTGNGFGATKWTKI